MEGVVSAGEKLEGGARAKAFAEGIEEIEIREVVAGALEEEHWDLNIEKVLRAIIGRLTGRVQREAKEYQSAHFRQGRCGLGL